MKKIIYKVMSVMVVGITLLSSCDKGFEEVNTDPINIRETTANKLLAPALVNSLAAGMLRNRNFNNELMQVTVSISDGDATVFRYEYRRSIADYLWNSWYVQLTNFKDMYKLAGEPDQANKSYQGISLICQAWLYSNLTDTYGDVPYLQSAQGKEGILEPAFDRQKDIYNDIYKKLEEANTLLTAGTAITTASDPVFAGNVARWRKLGNSLYLRLLLRTSGKSEVSAVNIAKIKQIVENPTTYPIMTSNAESGVLKWSGEIGTGAYVSPFVNNVRAQDFRAPAIGSFFIDHLRDWQDPRIDISASSGYPATGQINRFGIAQGSSGFVGVPSGYAVGAGVTVQSYFYATDNTVSSVAIGARSLQQSPLTGIIMNYAELQFILAEAALKGWITTGTAESYYNTGIASSINYWVPSFPASATDAKVISYINNADIDWNPALSVDGKMEQIHLQKYYALFLVDMQQWFEYRRTGHPVLPKGPGLRNGGVMPARMTYPVYVESANPTNYKAAVAAQGADEIFTNVWWQKP
ncbi:SusD/RagB family nutrient-binding outer membrane lipoprotein [Pedobacter frigiditerrae]|uniref:SusD/RagB family nutrient-binding outer membrane lipoprotein n=1 Tax=Pedobacter frigiditerrae TaxID=2530452 RepID=UPI00292D4D95|nr:SusD/RagB family nutrient-binding outer membrane lipoprotein [Pedobacter frigiditerrae]